MIYTIPLSQVPSQARTVPLDGQPCSIELRELEGRQYFSLSLAGEVICQSVLLVNKSWIVRSAYKGFKGDLFVVDTQGDEAPQYTGWGTRWLLAFSDEV